MEGKDFSCEIQAGWMFEERALSCARGGLVWILGEISPWKKLSAGWNWLPREEVELHPWKCSKNMRIEVMV